VWGEIESIAVKVDGGLEVRLVSITADATLDRHDFAVHPFGDGLGDSVGAVADDVGGSLDDRLGNL